MGQHVRNLQIKKKKGRRGAYLSLKKGFEPKFLTKFVIVATFLL